MCSFDDLTPAGRTRRLRQLVIDYLADHHAIHNARVQLLASHSFNTMFRVDVGRDDAMTPQRSVVRVGSTTRIHPVGVEQVEAQWLAALNDAGLTTLRTIPDATGSWSTLYSSDGAPGPHVCTRFSWVRGRDLHRRIDARSARQAGRVLGELHAHASSWSCPVAIPSGLHARSAIYFGERNMVADYVSSYGSLFVEATGRVQQHIDELWASADEPHLLHGDFGPHNILRYHNRLQPIDFQDLRLGLPVQDLGISLADLGYRNAALVTPFIDGYRDVAELPDLSPKILATHAAGRSLNLMDLALLAPASGIGTALETYVARVVEWMNAD